MTPTNHPLWFPLREFLGSCPLNPNPTAPTFTQSETPPAPPPSAPRSSAPQSWPSPGRLQPAASGHSLAAGRRADRTKGQTSGPWLLIVGFRCAPCDRVMLGFHVIKEQSGLGTCMFVRYDVCCRSDVHACSTVPDNRSHILPEVTCVVLHRVIGGGLRLMWFECYFATRTYSSNLLPSAATSPCHFTLPLRPAASPCRFTLPLVLVGSARLSFVIGTSKISQ